MDLINLLGYLFKTDPKLKNVQLPENPLSVDIPGLMEMLKDPSVTTIKTLPLIQESSEMCLSVPDDTTSTTGQVLVSQTTTPKILGSTLGEPSLQAISPTRLQRLNPLSSTLKPNDNVTISDSTSMHTLREVSDVSTVPIARAISEKPLTAFNVGTTANKNQHSYPTEFIKRVIPISRTFYLSYCVFDYWTLFSGLYTSPMRLKRVTTNEKPRAAPYIELLDEDSFKETLTAMRANLNLPAAELIAIAEWIGKIYVHIHSKRMGEAEMTSSDIVTLPCFRNGLLFLLITLSQLFRRLEETDLAAWVEALCSSQLNEELPPAMLEDQSALISTNLLANLASRHIMLLASSLLEQLNKRFSSFFELSPVRWEKLSAEVEKLYIICKSFSVTTSFVNTSLDVSSLEAETGLHLDALSGISDMAGYKETNPGALRPEKDFSQTSLSERFCLAMDAIFKILHHMSGLADDKSHLCMIDRLALFAPSTCMDFIEELIRLLVQNMDTQSFYEECDPQTLHTCWSMVDLLYKTYIQSMLLKCKQSYGFVSSGDNYTGLVFGPISDTSILTVSSVNQISTKTPGSAVTRKKSLRKEHVLTTYDSYSFFLVILKLCNFRLVQNQVSYNSILTFLREYVRILDRSEVDEVCSIIEPYLSDYTGNFHSNGYGLRYTLTIMHIVFSKYYESDDFSSLQLGPQCSKAVLSTPEAMYIYQVRLQKYLCTAVTRQLNRLYSQSEAEAIDELMTCTSIRNYLSESPVDEVDVIELDLNDLAEYTFQQVTEEDSEAHAQKQAEKEALKASLQLNCKPNPFIILAKLFLILVDQINVDASIHLPIFSDAFFDSSIMSLEHGSGLSTFLYNVYMSTSFCSVSRFVGMPSPQPTKSPLGSPLVKQIPGLLSESHCELATETVVMEENAGKIRISPISIYAGLIIKFINDKVSAALVTFSQMGHSHHLSNANAASPSREVHNILSSPELIANISKIKFQEVKEMLKYIDMAMMTLGLAFYKFYLDNKVYRIWMDGHLCAASITQAKHSVVKKSLSFIFPPDISIILATPLLSFYITREADHISAAVKKIYDQETNLNVLPFNWLITNKTLLKAHEITDASKRCNALHYNASSAPIDGIEPVLLFLESIFSNFHLSAACLRCLCSQILDLIRVILQPIYYNNNIIEHHKIPILMQLFSIDQTLQSKNMMKQSTTKKSTSISTESSPGSILSEKSFTSSCLSAQIISQKGYKSSLDVASSIAQPKLNREHTKHIFSWDVDNTGQNVNSSKNELLVGKLTIRRRMNSITLKARSYANHLSPEESVISSILPMGSGVPSGALLFSSCNLTEPPRSFSDIIQLSRVFTYRVNSLEVLLARIASVYDYLSSNSVSYDTTDTVGALNTDALLDLGSYWIINTKQAQSTATKPAKDESTMLLEYFSSIVKEIRSTIMINIRLLCEYLINTGLCPLLQRAYCPVVMQTQLRTAWSGLEIALKDIYRNVIPSYIKCIAEHIAVAALNAHSFILLDSGPRARTITPSDSKILNDDLLFLKEVIIGNSLCGEEYIMEYKRLFKAAHVHGIIKSTLPNLYLSVDEVGADYMDCILKPSFVSAKAIQAEDLVCLHTLKSEKLMSMGNVEDNYMLLEQLDTPKNLTTDVITHSEYVVRVLNFRRYSEPLTREWLHKLKKSLRK